jgi:hypothetical protein
MYGVQRTTISDEPPARNDRNVLPDYQWRAARMDGLTAGGPDGDSWFR